MPAERCNGGITLLCDLSVSEGVDEDAVADLTLSKDQVASIGRLFLTVRELLESATPDLLDPTPPHAPSPRTELVGMPYLWVLLLLLGQWLCLSSRSTGR